MIVYGKNSLPGEKMKKAQKSKPNSGQFTPDFWVTIRTLYESGQFESSQKLHNHLKTVFKRQKIPTLAYLKRKITLEGWNKHASDAEIAEKKAKSIEEIFESYGMPLEERIKRNVHGITAVDVVKNEIFTLIKTAQEKINSSTDVSDAEKTISKTMELFPSLLSGLRLSLDYLKNTQSLCGDNAPEKRMQLENKRRIDNEYDQMTDDELEKELERLQKNRTR